MLPDVIDLEELRTGERREGDLYSLFLVCQKSGLGLAMAISSWTLGWAGYENPDEEQARNEENGANALLYQPDSVILVLRLMCSLVPAGLILLSFIAAYLYPITKARHQEIVDELNNKKAVM
jgi:GPH family glycoside/pentoside/hexuronide:cation symporter